MQGYTLLTWYRTVQSRGTHYGPSTGLYNAGVYTTDLVQDCTMHG